VSPVAGDDCTAVVAAFVAGVTFFDNSVTRGTGFVEGPGASIKDAGNKAFALLGIAPP